ELLKKSVINLEELVQVQKKSLQQYEKTSQISFSTTEQAKTAIEELKKELSDSFATLKNDLFINIENKLSVINSNNDISKNKKSYSDCVKKHDSLIVTPKDEQTSKVTLQYIKESINSNMGDI